MWLALGWIIGTVIFYVVLVLCAGEDEWEE